MSKTLTIMLMSGSAENEDAQFATNLAEAALEKGHKVQMYLFRQCRKYFQERRAH